MDRRILEKDRYEILKDNVDGISQGDGSMSYYLINA